MSKVKPDKILAAIVGATAIPRTQITKKLWVYIKKNKLQDPKNGQYILAKKDAKFRKFAGTDRIIMFKLAGLISKHVTK